MIYIAQKNLSLSEFNGGWKIARTFHPFLAFVFIIEEFYVISAEDVRDHADDAAGHQLV